MSDNQIATTIASGIAAAVRADLDAALADMRVQLAAALDDHARALVAMRDQTLTHLTARALDLVERAGAVKDGAPGPKGDQGEPGQPGTIAAAVPYVVGEIYAAGSLVTLPPSHVSHWALARALADTYDIPGDPDSVAWEPLLFHGQPGPGFNFRGSHMPGDDYARGDIVASPAGSLWLREVDGPSDRVPGPDWALFLKRGATGGRGRTGDQGAPGADAPCIEAIGIEHGQLVTLLTDGTILACAIPTDLGGAP